MRPTLQRLVQGLTLHDDYRGVALWTGGHPHIHYAVRRIDHRLVKINHKRVDHDPRAHLNYYSIEAFN